MSSILSSYKETRKIPTNQKDICLYQYDIKERALKINYDYFIFCVGGEFLLEDTFPTNNFLYYSPIVYEERDIVLWKKKNLTCCPTARSCAAFVLFENFLYLLGGYDGEKSISSIERYCFLSNRWDNCPSLTHRRSSPSSVLSLFNGKPIISTFGGVQIEKVVEEIEHYDVQENKVYESGKLLIPRSSCKAYLIESDKVCILGGITNSEELNMDLPMEIYNLRTKEQHLTNSKYSYYGFAFLSCNSSLTFMAGGCKSSNKSIPTNHFFVYNNDQLQQLSSLIYERCHSSLFMYQDRIICAGGYDKDKNIVSKAEYYIHSHGCWKVFDFLFHPYSGSATFVYRANSIIHVKRDENGNYNGFINSNVYLDNPFESGKKDELLLISSSGQVRNNLREGKHFMSLYWNDDNYEGKMNERIIYNMNKNISMYRYEFEKNVENLTTEIPIDFICPITREIMFDPVIIESGNTFERDAIQNWLKLKKEDPLTKQKIKKSNVFFQNILIRNQIYAFMEKNN